MSREDERTVWQIMGPVFFIAGIIIGAWVATGESDEVWHKLIIENEAGQYNSTTGIFEWIKKADR